MGSAMRKTGNHLPKTPKVRSF